jgi:carbon-monoxide dehydrogenase small subunit
VSDEIEVAFEVNGTAVAVHVEPRRLLADVLRHDLGLTGTHLGCEHGVCGACTVLVDGMAVRSCLMLAPQVDGCAVETVEGLASGDSLHPIQQAFADQSGLQCGFCTPGFLMAVTELLGSNPDPSDDQIRDHLSGNICRCTGYLHIVRAVQQAAAEGRAQP